VNNRNLALKQNNSNRFFTFHFLELNTGENNSAIILMQAVDLSTLLLKWRINCFKVALNVVYTKE